MSTLVALLLLTTACSSAAGDGPVGPDPQLTIDGRTVPADAVSCTQIEWNVMIDAGFGDGEVRAFVLLNGTPYVARTVNIDNVDGFSGIAGNAVSDVKTDVVFDNGSYVITGTARGNDPDMPGGSITVPYRFVARC